jgi:hypothetical protein
MFLSWQRPYRASRKGTRCFSLLRSLSGNGTTRFRKDLPVIRSYYVTPAVLSCSSTGASMGNSSEFRFKTGVSHTHRLRKLDSSSLPSGPEQPWVVRTGVRLSKLGLWTWLSRLNVEVRYSRLKRCLRSLSGSYTSKFQQKLGFTAVSSKSRRWDAPFRPDQLLTVGF